MGKLVFSSEQLPAELDDAARFALWQELYVGTICHFDVKRLPDRPFAMHYEFASFGAVALASCKGTINEFNRTRIHAANDPNENFFLNFNGTTPWSVSEPSGEYSFGANACVFIGEAGIAHAKHHAGSEWHGIVLPRQRLLERVFDPNDHSYLEFDPSSEVVRHLRRYTTMLLGSDDVGNDVLLGAQLETTLLDLAGLLFKGRRDAADLARMRGLRAARLQEILTEIRRGFADPGFTPAVIASRLRCSENYIQRLLHETGMTFSERVLELRLQKARDMLSDRKHDRMRIADIALACGFNEVSYFNRCFRRRFGAPPTECRGNQHHEQ